MHISLSIQLLLVSFCCIGNIIAAGNNLERNADGVTFEITCNPSPIDVASGSVTVDCPFSISYDQGISYVLIYSALANDVRPEIQYPYVPQSSGCLHQFNQENPTTVSGVCQFLLPQYAPPGEYNVTIYSYRVTGPWQSEVLVSESTSFEVLATTNDLAPPTIIEFSAPVMNSATQDESWVYITVADEMTGVAEIMVFAEIPGSAYLGSAGVRFDSPYPTNLSYTMLFLIQDATYSAPPGEYKVRILVRDAVGNSKTYSYEELTSMGINAIIVNEGVTSCGQGLSVCKEQCYNPQSMDCIYNILCPKGFQVCGEHCYNPHSFSCLDSPVGMRICEKGFDVCGGDCYNPTAFNCFAGSTKEILCEKQFSICGDSCYHTESHQCCNGTLLARNAECL